jgi:hypothetical protein
MKNRLPAGEYYIGDPCYVIENDRWDEWLELFWDNRPEVFDFDAADQIAFNTAYGDGAYDCSNGASLPVDAGIIGAIPMSIIKCGRPEVDGTVVTFETAFTCEDRNGLLIFGDLEVDTDPSDNDEVCEYCGGMCCR